MAMGFNIIFYTTKTFNFAHGDLMILGALTAFFLTVSAELNLALTFIVVFLFIGVIGIVIQIVAVKPVVHLRSIGWIMSTVGVGIIIKNTNLLLWGSSEKTLPSPFGDNIIHLAGIGIFPQEIFIICLAFSIMILVEILLKKNIIGKALEAVGFNQEVARLMGINVGLMVLLAWGLASGFAGVAGILIAPVAFINIHLGLYWGVKSFCAAVIGGLDKPIGGFLGGILLGVVENVAAYYHSALRDIVTFVIILVFLSLKPSGLFGKSYN
jgi:branched-chain amino acid transport system permease protein